MRRAALLLVLALPVGCGGGERPRTTVPATWRAVATDADRERLRGWRDAWLEGLGRARAAGAGERIAAEGALLDPDRVLPGALPPEGAYRCRSLRLGARGSAHEEYAGSEAMPCVVASIGGAVSFSRDAGPQRLAGTLYPDTGGRVVFLGTLAFDDERAMLRYGRDPARDLAGLVERVGERRWRLALPRSAFGSVVEVIELVPAG